MCKISQTALVLGELAMGMIIGPYALGKLPKPGIGPLFPIAAHTAGQSLANPVSNGIYFLAQIAIIILLFSAGLGTDYKQLENKIKNCFQNLGPSI